MEPLYLRKESRFEKGKSYSICFRGARCIDTSDEFDLSIYTPENWEKPQEIANIITQKSYKFSDLIEGDFADNYDESARTWDGFKKAVLDVYPDLEEREIVTIVVFEIQ